MCPSSHISIMKVVLLSRWKSLFLKHIKYKALTSYSKLWWLQRIIHIQLTTLMDKVVERWIRLLMV